MSFARVTADLVGKIETLTAERDALKKDVAYARAEVDRAVAAERDRWIAASTAAVQELCHCAPWTAGGQALAALRELIDGPNVVACGP
jgi:hypothetical protein